MPEPTKDTAECKKIDKNTKFVAGDLACDQHVWRCRDFSGQDFCNYHAPNSENGFYAWELVNSWPKVVTPEQEKKPEE